MNKSIIALLIAAPLAFSLSGCVVKIGGDEDGYGYSSDYQNREYENRKKIARLHPGMNFNEVHSMMGVADFNESYLQNEQNVQVLYYRTQRTVEDGLTTKDECSKIMFVDGKLTNISSGG